MKQLDVKVGMACNSNCIFCAQAHKRKYGNKTTETLKREIREGRENGDEKLVLTGGEPTVRDDILELVRHAKKLDFDIIQIQTNGRMLSYEDFAQKMIKAGANEFAISIHGHNSKINNVQTRVKCFEQRYNAIKDLREMGQRVLTNTVITKYNYKHLPEIAEMLVDLNVDQFQFAFVHPTGNAWRYREKVVPRKSDVEPYVHRALDVGKGHGIRMMVEAYPYCFMQGYEEYVSQLYMADKAEIKDMGMEVKDWEEERIKNEKIKFEKCKDCKYFYLCEGPWKEYPKIHGREEFEPVEGEQIKNPDELLEIQEKRLEEERGC